jgi:hypothetical protein
MVVPALAGMIATVILAIFIDATFMSRRRHLPSGLRCSAQRQSSICSSSRASGGSGGSASSF